MEGREYRGRKFWLLGHFDNGETGVSSGERNQERRVKKANVYFCDASIDCRTCDTRRVAKNRSFLTSLKWFLEIRYIRNINQQTRTVLKKMI